MNIEDTCVNCGRIHMTPLDNYIKYLMSGVAFIGNLQGCCETPKKATKNDIVNKILSDL